MQKELQNMVLLLFFPHFLCNYFLLVCWGYIQSTEYIPSIFKGHKKRQARTKYIYIIFFIKSRIFQNFLNIFHFSLPNITLCQSDVEYTYEAEVHLKIFGPKILSSSITNFGEVNFNPKFTSPHEVLLSTMWR